MELQPLYYENMSHHIFLKFLHIVWPNQYMSKVSNILSKMEHSMYVEVKMLLLVSLKC